MVDIIDMMNIITMYMYVSVSWFVWWRSCYAFKRILINVYPLVLNVLPGIIVHISMMPMCNPLAPGWCGSKFDSVISEHILRIKLMDYSCKIAI